MTSQKIRIAKEPMALAMLARATGRFLTGRPMLDGQDRTDATWTHKASQTYGDRRAGWWSYQTKTFRVGARLAGLGATGGVGYGLATAPEATLDGLHAGGVTLASVAAGTLAYLGTDAALAWEHNRYWVWPLHLVLVEALGLPRGTRPRHYLTIPRNYHEIEGDAVAVEIPPAKVIGNETRQQVQSALVAKLAMQEIEFSWRTTGPQHHLVVRQRPRPPAVAKFSEDYIRAAVEKAKDGQIVFGPSHAGKMVDRSIDSDSPHILVVMGTGGGKSETLKGIIAQMMHHGAEVIILDYKQTSQPWIRRIRGVRYARTEEAIHDALLYVGEKAQERRQVTAEWIDAGRPGDGPPIKHRILCVLEEANTTIPELKKYWDRIRDKDNDPKESPALTAYFQALNMGRSEKVHFMTTAQDAKEQFIGSRNNYGLRIMGAYTSRMWNLIAGDAGTMPKKSRHKGRVQVVDSSATETQMILWADEDAYEWATSGIGRTASPEAQTAPEAPIAQPLPGEELPALDAPQPASHAHTHAMTGGGMPGETRPEPHAPGHREAAALPDNVTPIRPREQQAGPAAGDGQAQGQAPADVELVNMSQASNDNGRGIIPMKAATIRRARLDDPEFPPPDGVDERGRDAWRPETLQKWHRNRPRTASKG